MRKDTGNSANAKLLLDYGMFGTTNFYCTMIYIIKEQQLQKYSDGCYFFRLLRYLQWHSDFVVFESFLYNVALKTSLSMLVFKVLFY